MKGLPFGVMVLSVVLSEVMSAHADYLYTTLDVPGAISSEAYGINDAGQIVGQFRTGGLTVQTHGFLFSGGGYNQLDVPGIHVWNSCLRHQRFRSNCGNFGRDYRFWLRAQWR